MAWTIEFAVDKAALDGICTILNGGKIVLNATGPSELATLVFNATAFGAATTARPSVALSNAITADATVTPGTITQMVLQTSGNATRFTGTVGVGAGYDFAVSTAVIPPGTTSVGSSGIQLSLSLA